MSAYLVSDKQFSVMAKSLAYYCNENIYTKDELQHLIGLVTGGNEFKYLTGNWMAEKFMTRMYLLNIQSLVNRYGEEIEPVVCTYDDSAPVLEIPALIKLIENWQYQSCEGDCDKTQAYIMFDKIKNQLALFYATKSIEGYWGIDDYSDINESDIAISGNAISLMSLVN